MLLIYWSAQIAVGNLSPSHLSITVLQCYILDESSIESRLVPAFQDFCHSDWSAPEAPPGVTASGPVGDGCLSSHILSRRRSLQSLHSSTIREISRTASILAFQVDIDIQCQSTSVRTSAKTHHHVKIRCTTLVRVIHPPTLHSLEGILLPDLLKLPTTVISITRPTQSIPVLLIKLER